MTDYLILKFFVQRLYRVVEKLSKAESARIAKSKTSSLTLVFKSRYLYSLTKLIGTDFE